MQVPGQGQGWSWGPEAAAPALPGAAGGALTPAPTPPPPGGLWPLLCPLARRHPPCRGQSPGSGLGVGRVALGLDVSVGQVELVSAPVHGARGPAGLCPSRRRPPPTPFPLRPCSRRHVRVPDVSLEQRQVHCRAERGEAGGR